MSWVSSVVIFAISSVRNNCVDRVVISLYSWTRHLSNHGRDISASVDKTGGPHAQDTTASPAHVHSHHGDNTGVSSHVCGTKGGGWGSSVMILSLSSVRNNCVHTSVHLSIMSAATPRTEGVRTWYRTEKGGATSTSTGLRGHVCGSKQARPLNQGRKGVCGLAQSSTERGCVGTKRMLFHALGFGL